MALPAEFNTITIIQDYVDFHGKVSTGTVSFEPPRNTFFKVEPSDVVVTPKPIIGTLNAAGRLEVTLPFSDDPNVTPHFTYHVTENIDGISRVSDIGISVDLVSEGQPVKLYDLVPVGIPVVTGSNLLTKTEADLTYQKKGTSGGSGGTGFATWTEMAAFYPDMPTVFPPRIGPNATDAVAGNDPRLTNTRTPSDNSVSTVKIVDGAVTSAKIADGTIVNADVSATAAISLEKTVDGANRLAMSTTERSKLGTIASGATANSADSTLLNRANHTGVQAISTVDGLQTALNNKADMTYVNSRDVDVTQAQYDSGPKTAGVTYYVVG